MYQKPYSPLTPHSFDIPQSISFALAMLRLPSDRPELQISQISTRRSANSEASYLATFRRTGPDTPVRRIGLDSRASDKNSSAFRGVGDARRLHRPKADCERRRVLRGYHFDFADELNPGPNAVYVHDPGRNVIVQFDTSRW